MKTLADVRSEGCPLCGLAWQTYAWRALTTAESLDDLTMVETPFARIVELRCPNDHVYRDATGPAGEHLPDGETARLLERELHETVYEIARGRWAPSAVLTRAHWAVTAREDA